MLERDNWSYIAHGRRLVLSECWLHHAAEPIIFRVLC